MLDDQGARPHSQYFLDCSRNARFLCKEFGLHIVDQQNVHAFQGLEQVLAMVGIGDPIIHRIAADELHTPIHLATDIALQDGINVGEKQVLGVQIFSGNLRVEALKDV